MQLRLMLTGEIFVTLQRAIFFRKALANAIDCAADGRGEDADDFFSGKPNEIADSFDAEKLKDLAGFVVLMEKHVELLFLSHERPAQ